MLISIWHLLWIIPLSSMAGFLTAALCAAAGESDDRNQINKPPVNQ